MNGLSPLIETEVGLVNVAPWSVDLRTTMFFAPFGLGNDPIRPRQKLP